MPKAVFTKAAIKRAWRAAQELGIEFPRILVTAEGNLEISQGSPPDPRRMKVYDLKEEDDDGFEAWSRAKGL